jgi:hypothetical protein
VKKAKKPTKAAPIVLPKGYVAGRLIEDLSGLVNEARVYRSAYERLTGAVDELAKRSPYRALAVDLKGLLERNAATNGGAS